MFPVPFNERRRLEVLDTYTIIETPPDSAFDDLTELARRQFSVPIAVVSLLDSSRQWFKWHPGLEAKETSRDVAFCAHAILSSEPLVVLDATQDPRFNDNGLVTSDPHIRFYAGAPLITQTGFRLGTFCIIDTVPRTAFASNEIADLERFACITMKMLEKHRDDHKSENVAREAELAEEARRDLFALVAHEIRSPISSMISLTRAIDERVFGPLSNPRYEEFLSDLTKVAEQVGEITDRMLDFARLGAGEINVVDETVSLAELMEASRLATQGQAAAKDQAIDIDPISQHLGLRADRILLLQMLNNLISNAIKFSPEKGHVSVSAAVQDSGGVEIWIEDSGPGLSEDEIAHILQDCQTVGHAASTDSGGTGFGLPLVRRLVELHGGRIVMARGRRGGTVTTLSFPSYRSVDLEGTLIAVG
jgi:two-component system, sensor histidine kinase